MLQCRDTALVCMKEWDGASAEVKEAIEYFSGGKMYFFMYYIILISSD